MRKALVVCVVGVLGIVVACGGGKGDSCDDEGKVGECDDGFVCGKSKNANEGDLVCLTICDTQINCAASEECDGVGNTSLKGCRPR